MNTDIATELRSLAAGTRAVAAVFTLVLSYFNVRLALQIGHFEQIFTDMLGGRPLPSVTSLVLHSRAVFLLLSLAIPLTAIVVVWRVRSHKTALYSLAALMIVAFLQVHLTWTGMFAPLMTIVHGLGAQ